MWHFRTNGVEFPLDLLKEKVHLLPHRFPLLDEADQYRYMGFEPDYLFMDIPLKVHAGYLRSFPLVIEGYPPLS